MRGKALNLRESMNVLLFSGKFILMAALSHVTLVFEDS
jgi:hypothetical protein